MILTFDDGPSEWTDPILDLLEHHDVRATFFVVGSAIGGREATLLRIVADGHRVGNHTWTHRRIVGLSPVEIEMELRATQHLVSHVVGVAPSVWRAPFYNHDHVSDRLAVAVGCGDHLGSDVVPDDWNLTDPAEIARRVLTAGVGKVVTLHDGVPPDGGSGSASRQATVDALQLVLEAT